MGKLRLRRASHLPRPYSWPRAVLQNIPVDFKSRAKNKRHRYVCDKAPPLCMWQDILTVADIVSLSGACFQSETAGNQC